MCGIWFGINSSENQSQVKQRGPDETTTTQVGIHQLVFHRLRIHDLVGGSQPFVLQEGDETIYCMVNGEIYNHLQLNEHEKFPLQSKSDCEIVIHLYKKYGSSFYIHLDGEFAVVILHKKGDSYHLLALRDHVGVKPLFWGFSESEFAICSEAKGLTHLKQVSVLEPRFVYESNWYHDMSDFVFQSSPMMHFPSGYYQHTNGGTLEGPLHTLVHFSLTNAVKTRLSSDRPLGAFLSGGLDSSIICALASKELKKQGKQLQVFTIALPNSTDLPFAKQVAEHIGAQHHIVHITPEKALQAIDETILAIESYDTTTVRASVMQFLLSKWISENTDVKVLLVGELSDELFNGYLYSHHIKDEQKLREDAIRLVNEIHYFDGLRTERTTAYHGLEVRVPFSDSELIDHVFYSGFEETYPQEGMEKYVLRKAFEKDHLLPDEVLWRKKEAFSDACSSKEKSWYQIIQDEMEKRVSDEEFHQRPFYSHNRPMTKEQYYYRKVFEKHFGSKCETLIPHFWIPKGMNVINNEPSARVYFDI